MNDEQKDKQEEQEVIYEEAEETDDGADLDVVKEKIMKIKEKLKKCQEEKQEYLTGWQREKADFINFKRRQEEQMGEWMKIAQAGLMNDLLPVLDTIEAGFKNYDLRFKNEENIGMEPVKKQLMKILKKHGLEEIKAIGEKFNPEFHEAIESVESTDNEEGKIVEEAQKGYLLNGKVLRTSKVKVIK